ncbi:MAG: Ras GTPase-activating-like protein iqgap2 [Marteilia pararefringens]
MTNQSSDIFSINPIQIYVELKQSEAALDLSVAKVMEDHSVALRLKKNIDIVIELVESLMNSLRTCVPYMPYLYRAIVQFVWCEVEGLDQKHRIQIVSNLVLSKLVAQMITLPEQFDYTDKKPGEIGERQRKLMTLVAGIVVAIGMNQKFKGDHLEKLDKYVLEKHQEWLAIVEKISDIPNITENYQVPKQSEFIDDSESVTVRIEKIVALHEYILKYKSELCVKENDLLAPLLAEFPEPKIENFLRDPNVNAVTKKEMSRKLVTIELVRQVKVATKRKEDTPKHLMIRLKILFSQLLFAIDRSKFSPERIQDILEHEWLESEISKHASNNQLLKGLSDSAGQNYTSPASSQLSFSLNTLPEITRQCRDILESLVKLGTLTPDDDYDVLVQQIASDIRSEHSRKIEMRHEISLLTVTKTKLVESSDHLDKKIPFLESYITSLKSNLSNKKKRQKRTRFFSTRSSSSSTSGSASKSNNSISKTSSFVGKKQTYSVEKLMKRQTIRKFSHADVKNLKGVQIRLVEEKPSQFTATLLVIGNPIEEKSISTSDVILMTYNKKETVDLFKGVTFDTKALYKILVSK